MSLLLEKIQKILALEQSKGFKNTSVSGGLDRFSEFIEQQSSMENVSREIAEFVISFFLKYPNLSITQRKSEVEKILAWINSGPDLDSLPEKYYKKHLDTPKSSRINIAQDSALYSSIQSLRGIGSRNSQLFHRLGVSTIYDLLRFFPRRYQDYSELKTIKALGFGDEVTIAGTITRDLYTRKSKSGKLKITETTINDTTGAIRLTWFNQPFISRQLSTGDTIVVSGKVESYLGRNVINNPVWEPIDQEHLHTNRIVPIYPATAGLSTKQIRKIIGNNLPYWSNKYREYFSEELIQQFHLLSLSSSITNIHFPESTSHLKKAKTRFAFEEIAFLILGINLQRRRVKNKKSRVFNTAPEVIETRKKKLPYTLTKAQEKAIHSIIDDLRSEKPMNRLLQGDVGSGKTVVAKFAIEMISDNMAQSALIAPTSILAEQHFSTLVSLLTESETHSKSEIFLLTGDTPKKEREILSNKLLKGEIKLLIGTHAILEDYVKFNDLQLVIIDEQHRFGVNQRSQLISKGDNPHALYLSATPIPRSLAMTVYGDLDVTTIDEMPPGRKFVTTKLVPPGKRKSVYKKIREEVQKGNQAFIIYPLIESDDEDDQYKSAVNEKDRLQKSVFPNLNVGLIHGRLKAEEKEAVMRDFRNHEYHILVSTTVIEVGVDIPDASIILIESANFFGLAQLHQLRGRVGRNDQDAYCFLIPQDNTAIDNERLKAMTDTHDGFKLAEIDLAQRGPGEFLGTRQSGYAGFRFATLADTKLIEKCRHAMGDIIKRDPSLSNPSHQLLKEELQNRWPEADFEFLT